MSYKCINSSNSGPTKLSATRKMTMGYMKLSKAESIPLRHRLWVSILGKGHSRRRQGPQMAMCEVLGWKLPGTGWLSRDVVPPSLIPAPDKDNKQIFHEIYLCESLSRWRDALFIPCEGRPGNVMVLNKSWGRDEWISNSVLSVGALWLWPCWSLGW